MLKPPLFFASQDVYHPSLCITRQAFERPDAASAQRLSELLKRWGRNSTARCGAVRKRLPGGSWEQRNPLEMWRCTAGKSSRTTGELSSNWFSREQEWLELRLSVPVSEGVGRNRKYVAQFSQVASLSGTDIGDFWDWKNWKNAITGLSSAYPAFSFKQIEQEGVAIFHQRCSFVAVRLKSFPAQSHGAKEPKEEMPDIFQRSGISASNHWFQSQKCERNLFHGRDWTKP